MSIGTIKTTASGSTKGTIEDNKDKSVLPYDAGFFTDIKVGDEFEYTEILQIAVGGVKDRKLRVITRKMPK